MRSIIATFAVLMLALGSVPASAHHPHSETKDYIGSYDPLSPELCDSNENRGINVGGACFDVPHSASATVSIEINDSVNSGAAFFYYIADANGDCADPPPPDDPLGACGSAGFGCPTANNIALPPSATTVEVYVSGFVLGPLTCYFEGAAGSAGAATIGTITTTFKA